MFSAFKLTPNSAQTYHLIAEAMKFAHHNRSKYIGDPSFSDIPYDMLLSKDLACKKAKKLISRKHLHQKKLQELEIILTILTKNQKIPRIIPL